MPQREEPDEQGLCHVLCLGLPQDGNVRVGFLPESERVLGTQLSLWLSLTAPSGRLCFLADGTFAVCEGVHFKPMRARISSKRGSLRRNAKSGK
jgi:hypothetical protein